MAKFRFPTNKEFNKIRWFLKDRFNYLLPDFLKLLIKIKGGNRKFFRIYSFSEKIIPKMRFENIGLFMGTWERNAFRVSLEAAEIIGKNATKNFIDLSLKEAEDWLRGKNLQKNVAQGSYLIKYKNKFLGGGYSDGKQIINYLPKIFNIRLTPSKTRPKNHFQQKENKKININNQEFIAYHQSLTGLNFNLFIQELSHPHKESIRVNPLKTLVEKLLQELPDLKLKPIPWSPYGYWVENENCCLSNNLNYILGDYYIQEASSMAAVVALDPRPGEKILDLCAAPGSKTTQIGEYLKQRGFIIANDLNSKRTEILTSNIQRHGLMNVIVTNMDGRFFNKCGMKFDKVLVDAPCSAVGKDAASIHKWSRSVVLRLSKLQKELIVSGFQSLTKGGVMVYSTCTTPLEENEEVVEYLLNKYRGEALLKKISISGLNFIPGLTSATRNAIRIFPYHNHTDSFFIALIKKLK